MVSIMLNQGPSAPRGFTGPPESPSSSSLYQHADDNGHKAISLKLKLRHGLDVRIGMLQFELPYAIEPTLVDFPRGGGPIEHLLRNSIVCFRTQMLHQRLHFLWQLPQFSQQERSLT